MERRLRRVGQVGVHDVPEQEPRGRAVSVDELARGTGVVVCRLPRPTEVIALEALVVAVLGGEKRVGDDAVRLVTDLGEDLRDRRRAGIDARPLLVAATARSMGRRIERREDRRERGERPGRLRPGVLEADALGGEALEVRRRAPAVSQRAQSISPKRVDSDQQHIERVRCRRPRFDPRCAEHDGVERVFVTSLDVATLERQLARLPTVRGQVELDGSPAPVVLVLLGVEVDRADLDGVAAVRLEGDDDARAVARGIEGLGQHPAVEAQARRGLGGGKGEREGERRGWGEQHGIADFFSSDPGPRERRADPPRCGRLLAVVGRMDSAQVIPEIGGGEGHLTNSHVVEAGDRPSASVVLVSQLEFERAGRRTRQEGDGERVPPRGIALA